MAPTRSCCEIRIAKDGAVVVYVNDKSIMVELATELLKCGFRQGENKQGNDPVLNQHKGQEEEVEIDKRTMPISREELLSGKCALKRTEDFDGNSDSTQEGYEGTWLTIPRSECLVKHSQWDKAIQTNVFKKPRRGRVNGRGVQTECAIESQSISSQAVQTESAIQQSSIATQTEVAEQSEEFWKQAALKHQARLDDCLARLDAEQKEIDVRDARLEAMTKQQQQLQLQLQRLAKEVQILQKPA